MNGPVIGGGDSIPPQHRELCGEETVITAHGIRFDYSVPRSCNKAKGHRGEHIYTPPKREPISVDQVAGILSGILPDTVEEWVDENRRE